jgi:hypothetical protein
MPLNRFRPTRVRIGFVTGTSASLASTLALLICSQIENGRAASALNGPSQWVWGRREARKRKATWRHTGTGYAIHHLASIFWATLHDAVFDRKREPKRVLRRCGEAALTAATAYAVDYYATPRRLRPGLRKHLSPPSIAATYAAFAAGIVAVAIVRDRRRRRFGAG